jgi:hypothetical protein
VGEGLEFVLVGLFFVLESRRAVDGQSLNQSIVVRAGIRIEIQGSATGKRHSWFSSWSESPSSNWVCGSFAASSEFFELPRWIALLFFAASCSFLINDYVTSLVFYPFFSTLLLLLSRST